MNNIPQDSVQLEGIYEIYNFENDKVFKKSKKKADINNEIKLDIQTIREKEFKENRKKQKLDEIKFNLDRITKENEDTNIKHKLKETINDLEALKDITDKNDNFKDIMNINKFAIDEYDEENILPDEDKIKIKERMATFKLKLYDKLDMKLVLEYWMDKRKELRNKKSTKIIPKSITEKSKIFEKEENKGSNSITTNVKYEFKKPNKEILKIIPFCSNIFNIEKKES